MMSGSRCGGYVTGEHRAAGYTRAMQLLRGCQQLLRYGLNTEDQWYKYGLTAEYVSSRHDSA